MNKYIIDLPNNVSTLVGTTSIAFGGDNELVKIPVSMLEKYEEDKRGGIMTYELVCESEQFFADEVNELLADCNGW